MPNFTELRRVTGLPARQLRALGFDVAFDYPLDECLTRLKYPLFSDAWPVTAKATFVTALGYTGTDVYRAWRQWWVDGDKITDDATHAAHHARHKLAVEFAARELLRARRRTLESGGCNADDTR